MPKPERLHRDLRRARGRATEKAQRRARRRETASQALERWRIESHVELVRQAGRLGWTDYEGTPSQRKTLTVELARTQASRAGVSNATWACATRKQRAEMIERMAA